MNKFYDYSALTFSQLVTKIENSRFFHLPKMVAEALRKIPTGGGSELPYKSYTALLTQTGTSAPVATILENTLGGEVVWSRDDEGEYVATSDGLFLHDKTFLIITPNQEVYYEFVKNQVNADELFLTQKLQTTNLAVDDLLTLTPIEIRVYV